MGYIKVTYYGNYKYQIENTFKDTGIEKVFFLYLIDKAMADIGSRKVAKDLIGSITSYVHDLYGTVEEMEEEFSHFDEVSEVRNDYEFSIKQELRSKDREEGYHLYVNTSFSPKFKFDVYQRFANSTILYMMSLRQRAASNTQYWNLDRFNDMLRFYDNYGYPSAMSVTEGPSHVLSETRLGDVVQDST